jgi:hypothetical protein
MYKDDSDVENPKLRRRKVKGWVVAPDGSKRLYQPSYFEIPRPRREIINKFIELDKEGKTDMLRQKLEKLIQEMKIESGVADDRLKYVANYYVNHNREISLIGKTGKRGFKLNKEAMLMLNMTETEAQKFEKILYEKMKNKGMCPNQTERDDIPDLEDNLDDEED